MRRPSSQGVPPWIGFLACVSALAACDHDEPAADPAPPAAAEAPREQHPARASDELIELDLSDEAVAALSLEELWELGARHLGWPAERPAGATRDQIHQRLLDGKYRDVGDSGYYDD